MRMGSNHFTKAAFTTLKDIIHKSKPNKTMSKQKQGTNTKKNRLKIVVNLSV